MRETRFDRRPAPLGQRLRLAVARAAAIGSLSLTLCCGDENERAPVAAADPAVPVGRSLVVVTLDTVRADHLGCYGYFRDTTPNLDAFAAESLRFTNCLAPIAHTTPSHLSLFTGLFPTEHGLTSNTLALRVDADAPLLTLARALRGRGLLTGGFVSAAPVRSVTGLGDGFQTWSEPAAHEFRRPARETLADAHAFLDRCGDRPFFAWIHLFDAHAAADAKQQARAAVPTRYRADAALEKWLLERGVDAADVRNPKRKEILAAIDDYDNSLHHLDQQLAPLLDRLATPAFRERTVVVITADHGEGLGQHGTLRHGFTAFREQFRVPLLIRAGGTAATGGATIETPLSTIDVIATIAGLAPSLADEALLVQGSGRDLLAADSADSTDAAVFAMEPATVAATALATERWHLIRRRDGEHGLFDLAVDPHQLVDVAAERRDVATALAARLEAEQARQGRRRAELRRSDGAAEAIDPGQMEQLRALGYAVGEGENSDDRR